MLGGWRAQCSGCGFHESSCPAAVGLSSPPVQQGDTQRGFSVTMLSTSVTISTMDPSTQEVEDTEASTPLNPLQDGCPTTVRAPSCWLLFFKPIAAIGVGTLLFGSGTTWSLLYFTQVGNVPYLLGPLLLSVGLMFLVTGLVWIPMLKQSLEHHALTKVNHGKGLQVEHRHH